MERKSWEEFRIEPKAVLRETGQLDKYCGLDFCGRGHYALGYCKDHHRAMREGRPLKPLLNRQSFGSIACIFKGCDGVATTRMPGSMRLCRAHVTQHFTRGEKELRPVRWRLNDGYNEDRTARVCKKCNEEKPLDEYYVRNRDRYGTGGSPATKCKECYKAEVAARKARKLAEDAND